MLLFLSLLLFVASGVRVPFTSQQVSWPGAPSHSFNSYSGYALVNASAGSNLFYLLFESQNNPKTDPVVLWLTGGPGCSSELAVLFENGPWTVASGGGSLVANPYSWNNNATIIYVYVVQFVMFLLLSY
jgi:carboxypeptidase C (cathepsin A)